MQPLIRKHLRSYAHLTVSRSRGCFSVSFDTSAVEADIPSITSSQVYIRTQSPLSGYHFIIKIPIKLSPPIMAKVKQTVLVIGGTGAQGVPVIKGIPSIIEPNTLLTLLKHSLETASTRYAA
jgi:hypothetical protein